MTDTGVEKEDGNRWKGGKSGKKMEKGSVSPLWALNSGGKNHTISSL